MKKTLVILLNIVITVLFFINNYNSMVNNLSREAMTEKTYINGHIQSSTQLIDGLIMYGELYFSHTNNNNSNFYNLLKHNQKTNTYNLNAVQNTPYENLVGNLNGIGQIPKEGIYKEEINLVLEYNNFFKAYSSQFENIDWIYYISENNFICAYPWAPLSSVAYSESLKLRDSYKMAIPTNNPNKDRMWTPIYLDASNRETLVTLSKPLYFKNQFMGVVSINITNKILKNSIKCDNMFYLFDDNGAILVTNQKVEKTGLLNIKDALNISDYGLKSLINIEKESIKEFENFYVCAVRCQNAPWTMIIMIPVWEVFLKACLYTLPLIFIGVFMVLALFEISKRKEVEAQLFNQTIKDALTGIYNRRYFMETLNYATSMYRRKGLIFSLIMVDIDFFKKINDTEGHAKGDEVLLSIASVLKNGIRDCDILSRWGGEEFLILLPSTDTKNAYHVAERLRATISETDFGLPWSVTCSFGIATMPSEKSEITGIDLVDNADKALYGAKESGRNKVVCFDIV